MAYIHGLMTVGRKAIQTNMRNVRSKWPLLSYVSSSTSLANLWAGHGYCGPAGEAVGDTHRSTISGLMQMTWTAAMEQRYRCVFFSLLRSNSASYRS